jgi:hypothetical protein
LSTVPISGYVSAMCLPAFLLPILLILTVLSWGSAASAHPCHELSAQTQPVHMHVAVQATSARHGVEIADSGPCPAGRCGAYCQMQCAAAIALPATLDIGLFPGRPVFTAAAIPANLGWPPCATQDPPRPSA